MPTASTAGPKASGNGPGHDNGTSIQVAGPSAPALPDGVEVIGEYTFELHPGEPLSAGRNEGRISGPIGTLGLNKQASGRLFCAFDELLTNAKLHGGATHATLRVELLSNGGYRLTYEDDGVSFDPQEIDNPARTDMHEPAGEIRQTAAAGLRNMLEIFREMGLRIEWRPRTEDPQTTTATTAVPNGPPE